MIARLMHWSVEFFSWIPWWVHWGVEFFGWWMLLGLFAAWLWMLVIGALRRRESRQNHYNQFVRR